MCWMGKVESGLRISYNLHTLILLPNTKLQKQTEIQSLTAAMRWWCSEERLKFTMNWGNFWDLKNLLERYLYLFYPNVPTESHRKTFKLGTGKSQKTYKVSPRKQC